MNCIHTQESLSQWIDGELSIGIEAELFGHLHDCEECRAFLKNLLKLNHELSAAQAQQVPASLDLCILSLPSSAKNPIKHIPWLRPERMYSFRTACLAVLVSIILTACISSFWYRYSYSQPQQTIVCLTPLPDVDVTGYVVVGHSSLKGNNQ
jgi:predicted anti-sigma-YlaC factor YlaD